MIKALNNLRIVGNFLKMIKGIHKKPSANIIFKGECIKAFPTGSETRRMSDLAFSIQHCSRSYSQCSHARKEIKSIQTGKEAVKLSLLADNTILHV